MHLNTSIVNIKNSIYILYFMHFNALFVIIILYPPENFDR